MLKLYLSWERFFRCCMVFSILCLLYMISVRLTFGQGSDWQVGNTIGLSAGTCIREGPGFSYRAHTRVPENNWTVKVIDGPRTADGRTWWDTSRNAAGDPSGGTGWVTQDQTDTNCDRVVRPGQPSAPTVVDPGNGAVTPPSAPRIDQDLIRRAEAWWYQQQALVKWSVAILALLVVFSVWRRVGSIVIEFISAAFLALVIWVVLNVTRLFWQEVWLSLARSVFAGDVPDLALLLGVLPLVGWGLSLLSRLIRGRF